MEMQNVRFNRIVEMLNQNPDDAFLLYALAQEYFNKGEAAKSIELYEKLLHIHPNYTAAFLHLGNAYLQLQQIDKAIATYEKGIDVCRQQQAHHDLKELQAALNNLED